MAGAVLAIGYIAIGFALYRQRVISTARVWDSDLLVFVAPAAAAFAGFTWAFWPRSTPPRSRWRATGYAVLATAASTYVCYFLAFNRYGT